MPPAPSSLKEPRIAKKVGIMQKPKGAVRAKSGCYTCRIRRKKCDEKRIGGYDDGPCETCSRLKLECLGFGAKRPEWLRENSRVSMIRDRIKEHLAAQGMIKGHAGSGSRSNVPEEFLRLSDPHGDDDVTYRTGGSSSSTDEGPHRAESVEDDDQYGAPARLYHSSGYQRFTAYEPSYRHYDDRYATHEVYSVDNDSRSHSPPGSPPYYPLNHPAEFDPVPFAAIQSSSHQALYSTISPAISSSFSPLYHLDPDWDPTPGPLYIVDDIVEEFSRTSIASSTTVTHAYPAEQYTPEFINTLMGEYINNVVRIQYLLGDRNILPSLIYESVRNHPDSHEAVNLLTRAYYGRQSNSNFSMLQTAEVQTTISALFASLNRKIGWFTADDAMAALHVVSLFLFEGGQGQWSDFLYLPAKYTASVLDNDRYGSPTDALEYATAKDQFVIKTTIWFDVLAAITLRRPPLLLNYIRALFRPNRSFVGAPPRYSMLSPMGCENRVVWALAEITALAQWKAAREAAASLSVRELVVRVQEIDEHLVPPPRPQPQPADADTCARAAAAEIFRTSARLFLRSVESGAYPHVREVSECARETYHAIMDVNGDAVAAALQQTRSAVVRSTVFGIFICGSLTDDPLARRRLREHLLFQTKQEAVGNCTAVAALLARMWDERDSGMQSGAVPWRERLQEENILLV